MRIVRFMDKENNKLTGIVTEDGIEEISGDIFGEWEKTGEILAESEVTLISPLEPNQVIGIGANYVATEKDRPEKPQDLPVFFFKPTSSVIGPGVEIRIPESVGEVKFESELAVVIGKETYQVDEDKVLDSIFGYTIANDITAPQYFHKDGHWTLGKSFDTFTPLGPVIETELDLAKVQVEAYQNGIKKQDSSTDLMIISITQMISYLSSIMTLKPGDVILTGSPVGAEFLKPGDKIECRIMEIGSLVNPVIKGVK
ncbi:fumarylacetoacetate hydrolase family protein [Litchfieldia salsa]|uniref:2-keto-4-pentenoate hydratase/2-oxohepta-3-ene-1,7-dioic acid hydratase (Catechol pathway) n=1 Tax=Litchfieldia salsa TaxID=930152 RepID=A0A1H0VKR8_9BACI|nr:fumarylacetoacetate hydrolase family protein [Litchfieldia salsa]SDP79117.1 2-keto-4-pentenoate hydratase/2-oxohepta-3-ene-1,7-dioic acid hydratase (catechol pathway) [Litchfieldia salsa]